MKILEGKLINVLYKKDVQVKMTMMWKRAMAYEIKIMLEKSPPLKDKFKAVKIMMSAKITSNK